VEQVVFEHALVSLARPVRLAPAVLLVVLLVALLVVVLVLELLPLAMLGVVQPLAVLLALVRPVLFVVPV